MVAKSCLIKSVTITGRCVEYGREERKGLNMEGFRVETVNECLRLSNEEMKFNEMKMRLVIPGATVCGGDDVAGNWRGHGGGAGHSCTLGG